MGLYDRDYQRGGYYGHSSGMHVSGPRTMATTLVLITAGVWLAQLFTGPGGWVTAHLALQGDWYQRPWLAYQLLTYGFLHDTTSIWHIGINMFLLWMFGREVEYRYGRREFLAFYLAAIVVAGLVWTFSELPRPGITPSMLGASGGVAAMVILFAMNFPHRTGLFMFIIPMPMWLLAVIFVALDAWGAMNRPEAGIAFTAHLGGAAFGFLYFQWGWRLERWLPSGGAWKRPRRRPNLRVVDPDEVDTTDSRVDEILKKIQEQGQDSLTRGERRILEQASREYQKRRR